MRAKIKTKVKSITNKDLIQELKEIEHSRIFTLLLIVGIGMIAVAPFHFNHVNWIRGPLCLAYVSLTCFLIYCWFDPSILPLFVRQFRVWQIFGMFSIVFVLLFLLFLFCSVLFFFWCRKLARML